MSLYDKKNILALSKKKLNMKKKYFSIT